MQARLSGRDLVLILAVVALWGYSFVLIKVALREVPPFALAALRFLFAAIPVCLVVRPPAMPAWGVIGYGLAIGVMQFGLLFLGMKLGMPAGISSLVVQVQVFFTMGLAALVLHDRLARHNIIGSVIAAVGVVVLGAYKVASGATTTFAGFLIVLVAAVGWAIGNVIAKRAAGNHAADMFALVVWSSLAPVLPLAAMSYALEGGATAWHAVRTMSATAWVCVLAMAYAATLFGFGTWNRLLHRYPTGLISPFALLVPVTGLASGVLFLGETVALAQTVGALLVLAGLLVNVYGARWTTPRRGTLSETPPSSRR
ncbi:MAG: EamA family transporter [Casimicrobiaceae bacterium]